jgi:L-aspartate oxidase
VSLPLALAASAITWEVETDVVVLGSGAAGLAAALAVRPVRSALIVTKDVLDAGSTAWAQGGLAGVLDPHDSIENHVADTLAAGAGLCDEQAVRTLVTEAPVAIRYLMQLGAAFDPGADGKPALTREGGHSHNRIVHAGGDQSGAEVQRTLDQSAVAAGVEVMDRAFALDLIAGTNRWGHRQAAGVRIARIDESGGVVSVGVVWARAVVVATGGFGQVFASTSNPAAVTGDGLALALRAGLPARDVEFVQFHPTVLWRGPDALGQQPLISEAVRGEGAIIFDAAGKRVMEGVHPQEDLAPRDVVAAAISRRMAEAPAGVDDHVYLDATHIGERFYERFPTITSACMALGIDPARDRIPVAPAAHFACGGIVADLDGRTEMVGLYAIGEVACTGVHGANRLASNSLTEGVVAGTRLGRALAWQLPSEVVPDAPGHGAAAGVLDVGARTELRAEMSRHVGVLRTPEGLTQACHLLEVMAKGAGDAGGAPGRRAWEATNMLTVAWAVATSAQARTESRGCHRRTDFADPREVWLRHLTVRLDSNGAPLAHGAPEGAPTVHEPSEG